MMRHCAPPDETHTYESSFIFIRPRWDVSTFLNRQISRVCLHTFRAFCLTCTFLIPSASNLNVILLRNGGPYTQFALLITTSPTL